MSEKENFDTPLDDELYNEALDENFEFDDDDDLYTDLDLGDDQEDGDQEVAYEEEKEDDWDDSTVSGGQKKSKFRLSFNGLVMIGGVLLGIVVMMSQVNKEKAALEIENPTDIKAPTALKMEGAFSGPGAIRKEKAGLDSVVVEEDSQEGFLFDGDILDDAKDIVADVPPMPSPIASEQNDVIEMEDENVSDISVTKEEQNEGLVPSTSDNDIILEQDKLTFDEALDVKQEENIQETAQKEAPTSITPTSITPTSIMTSTALEDRPPLSLDKKLDSIIQRLDKMESKIGGLETGNSDQLKVILTDIEDLKQQKSVVLQSRSTTPVKKKATESQMPKVVKKKSPRKVAKKVVWELRAAQPDKAWVSKKGQNNMKPVVVGDKLVGIGRIQSIDHVAGRWVVQGSIGKIMQ